MTPAAAIVRRLAPAGYHKVCILRPRDGWGLRVWLTGQKVTGYAQSLLVMEYFA